jgi:hypothetical protein
MWKVAYLLLAFLVAGIANGSVIFSEIMYRPRHSDEHQYVELFNSGSQLVDVTGWFLLYPGYIFQIPRSGLTDSSATLDTGAYLLIAANPSALSTRYSQLDPSKIVGPLLAPLPRDGDIQLTDPRQTFLISSGNLVTHAQWTNDDSASNGYGSSLEVPSL